MYVPCDVLFKGLRVVALSFATDGLRCNVFLVQFRRFRDEVEYRVPFPLRDSNCQGLLALIVGPQTEVGAAFGTFTVFVGNLVAQATVRDRVQLYRNRRRFFLIRLLCRDRAEDVHLLGRVA